jgi:parallel beta-helix repeat protein
MGFADYPEIKYFPGASAFVGTDNLAKWKDNYFHTSDYATPEATIEAAAAWVSSTYGGGIVHLENGTYTLGAAGVDIDENYIILEGESWDTIITTSLAVQTVTISGIGCGLRNIQVNHTGVENLREAVDVTGANCRVDTIYIQDSDQDSISMNGSRGILTNSYITNAGRYNITVGGTGDGSIIVNNICLTSGDSGIFINGAGNYCIVTGNRVEGWTGNDPIEDSTSTCTVTNNWAGGTVLTSKGCSMATIALAITYVAGDGWIYVPEGTWTENLVIGNSNTTLYGSGWGTIIDGLIAADAISVGGNNCTIRDLACRTTAGGGSGFQAMELSGNNIRVSNVYIYGSDSAGIYVNAGLRAIIENCYIGPCDAEGIFVNGDNCTITNCEINTTGASAIVCQAESLVSNCHIINVTGYGIDVNGGGDDSVIIGNSISTTSDDGIYLNAGAEYCVVTGNKIQGWTNQPVDDDSGTSVVASNNAGGSVMNSLGCSHLTIQGAIDHVEAFGGGGWIEIPARAASWVENLTIEDDGIELRGQGEWSILQPSNASGVGITVSGDYDGVIIRDLSIDTKTSSSGGVAILIEDGADRFLVENVRIIDSDTTAIAIIGTNIVSGRIINCNILGADTNGVYVDMDAGNTCSSLHISGCTITGCGEDGIYAGSTGDVKQWWSITDNIIYGNAQSGINLGEVSHSVVEGNICKDNTRHGIFLTNCDWFTVDDNITFANGGGSQTYDGIHLAAGCEFNVITGNVCQGNATSRRGISVHDNGNTVSNNMCSLNDYQGIYVSGADCIITGNTCYDNSQHAAGSYGEINVGSDGDRCVVSNNHCSSPGDSSEEGILIETGCHQVLVIGNYVYNGMGSGIVLGTNNDNCIISGNYCFAWDDYGIRISTADAADCSVVGNFCHANGSSAYLDNGTNTYMANNWAGGKITTSKGWTYATIAAAITAVGAQGWIEVPSGTWSEAVTLSNDNVILRGQGWDSIIDGGTTGHAISMTGDDCTVHDITVQTTGGATNSYDGIFLNGATNCRIRDVQVLDSDRHGINAIGGANGLMVRDCYITSADNDAMYIDVRCRVSGMYIYSVGGYGIYMAGTSDNSILDTNYINTTGNDGIYIHTNSANNIISSNRIRGWTGEAIDDDSGTATITGNNTVV